MKITRTVLKRAVDAGILDEKQALKLADFLASQPEAGVAFNLTNVLYYLGGMLAIGAMTLFMNLGWELFGGFGIFFLAMLYGVAGLLLAARFRRMGEVIPAGIAATFVVALTPLAIYGLQKGMGWWPDDSTYREYYSVIQWHWIFLELGTLAVGCVLAFFWRYPFMVMPISFTLWYFSMDVVSMLSGGTPSIELAANVSLWFGLGMLFIALYVDIRSRASGDYAFWLYLFGVLTFWTGLSLQDSSGEWSKFLYFCINLLLIGAGVVLVRRVFVVFGALGAMFYLQHLASMVFADSIWFPVILTLMGFGIITLGLWWQKHEAAITEKAQSFLPAAVRELLRSRGSLN
ncbi:membrane protein [Legionella geestiana]|uniref:Membrane protein n=1 Tax=Legionella geestiana TaxID=45065 RepID=A0A0W0TP88_9GAMM|nr:hypothetical protein [Legionella geestiana]KTC97409.1 membrane protein [Legionella geestiana]QBS12722.1 DUF2157 domain-containing protein [Legionella geestiana]STX54811.1 membrane protein [Legionella geestiana]